MSNVSSPACAVTDEEEDQEAGVMRDGTEEATEPQKLSSDHRTGLAKLPNVIEWLINKLGHGQDPSSVRSALATLPSHFAGPCLNA